MSIRVVYDSPMLVQRDEVVPTLVINPNNPPPWLQNSTTQQIVYVQQNYVPQQYIQQTDQVYLQQYAYQNPIYVQNYDPRIQIVPNIVTNERMLVPMNQQMQDELKKQQNQMAQILVPINQQTYQLDGDKLKEQQRQMTIVQMNQQVHQDTLKNQQMTQTLVQMNQPTHTNQQDGDKFKEQNQRIAQTFVPTNQQIPAIQDGDKLKQQSQYFQQIRPKRPIRNVRPRFMYRQIQPRLRYMPNVIQRIQIPNISTPNVINTNVLNPMSVTNNCANGSGNVGSNISTSVLNTQMSGISNSGNITNTLNPTHMTNNCRNILNTTSSTNNGTSNMSNVGTHAVQENMSVDSSLKDMSVRNVPKIPETNIGTNVAKTNCQIGDNTSLNNGTDIIHRALNTSQANSRPYSLNGGTETTEVKTIGVANDGPVNANVYHRLTNVPLSVTPTPNNTPNVYIVAPLSQTVRPSADAANVSPLSTNITPIPTTNIGSTNTSVPVSNAPNHTKRHSNVPTLLPIAQMNVPLNLNSTKSSAILKTNANIGQNIPNFGNTTSNVKISKNAPTQTNIGTFNTLKNNIVGPTNSSISLTRIESRKRKSQSPDEIKNKLHVLDINIDVQNVSVNNMQHSQSYNKVTKKRQNNVNCDKNMQIYNNDVQSYNNVMRSVDKDMHSDNMQKQQHADTMHVDMDIQDTLSQMQTKEKLIRNTVFTQARGRILNVKDNISTIDSLNKENDMETDGNIRKDMQIDENIRKDMEMDGNIRKDIDIHENIRKDMEIDENTRKDMAMDENIRKDMAMDENIRKDMKVDGNIRKDMESDENTRKDIEMDENTRTDMEMDENIRKDMKMDGSIRKDMEMNENTRKDMEMDESIRKDMKTDISIRKDMEMDGNIRKVNKGFKRSDEEKMTEKGFVLTHVLDGFVIQESNIAFPIRKPTVEKTIRVDADVIGKDLEEVIPSIAIVKEKSTNFDKNKSKMANKSNIDLNINNTETKDIKKSKDKNQSKVVRKEEIETKSKQEFRSSGSNERKNQNPKKKRRNCVKRKKEKTVDNERKTANQGINHVEDKHTNESNENRLEENVGKGDIENSPVQNVEGKRKEEEKDISVHIENLKRMENDEIGKKEENGIETRCTENPFSRLTPSVIKAWTMEKLTAHLSKNGWSETSSAFFEHEIDGESLLLVSKTQLLSIGVKDENADIIVQFVNS